MRGDIGQVDKLALNRGREVGLLLSSFHTTGHTVPYQGGVFSSL